MNPFPSTVCCRTPIDGFQSRIVVSRDADASRRPSGEKATNRTEAEWPSTFCYRVLTDGSQRWTVLSLEADASRPPSGEKATKETESEWPVSVFKASTEFWNYQ
ncbi:hypothetical protein N7530_010454 [Penicillium desertorum]|uniref:Uncharacterized protein n=1 Tax=Penicillium desertorum TaxID=1303715 RepID=A0A9X0BHN7_9EURO|nr:hypothetical protein N7530_010454 [Penicillium desertorum]